MMCELPEKSFVSVSALRTPQRGCQGNKEPNLTRQDSPWGNPNQKPGARNHVDVTHLGQPPGTEDMVGSGSGGQKVIARTTIL